MHVITSNIWLRLTDQSKVVDNKITSAYGYNIKATVFIVSKKHFDCCIQLCAIVAKSFIFHLFISHTLHLMISPLSLALSDWTCVNQSNQALQWAGGMETISLQGHNGTSEHPSWQTIHPFLIGTFNLWALHLLEPKTLGFIQRDEKTPKPSCSPAVNSRSSETMFLHSRRSNKCPSSTK